MADMAWMAKIAVIAVMGEGDDGRGDRESILRDFWSGLTGLGFIRGDGLPEAALRAVDGPDCGFCRVGVERLDLSGRDLGWFLRMRLNG